MTAADSIDNSETEALPATSARTYLAGAARVVESVLPGRSSGTVELWLRDAAGDWASRSVHSEDGIVGPPVPREPELGDVAVDVPTGHLPKPTSDFDFLVGTWLVRNRRLRERLTGCKDWDEFENRFEARTHLNGLVSIDEGALPVPSPYRGMTYRTFDVAAGEWVLHWFDSRDLRMDDAPVRGRFRDGPDGRVGEFLADDTHAGVPILCRFRWTVIGPGSATWEQAFSTDHGTTWETNWTNTQERIA